MWFKQTDSITRTHPPGFTIVELVIVVVVIGILSAIITVTYTGAQARAHDVAVESDLQHQGELIMANNFKTGIYPSDETALSQQGLQVTQASYGGPLIDGGTGFKYNALYCSTVAGYSPSAFAIISSSNSNNVFSFISTTGKVASFPTSSWTGSGWGTICPAILGVATGNSSTGIWLYENSIWKIWLTS